MENPQGMSVIAIDHPDDVTIGTKPTLKRQPVRVRHNPVGDIPTELVVDAVLKFIKVKDKARFKEIFAARVNWSSAEAMDRAHRRATRFARKSLKQGKRLPAYLARLIAEADLLSQAMVRRFN